MLIGAGIWVHAHVSIHQYDEYASVSACALECGLHVYVEKTQTAEKEKIERANNKHSITNQKATANTAHGV